MTALRECTSCKLKKASSDFYKRTTSADGIHTICKACLQASNRKYVANNRGQILAARRAKRAARTVEERARDLAQHRIWHEANRDAARGRQRAQRLAIKLQVLRHYGPACGCCGERDSRLLTIEHANGDGAAHRRETFGDRPIGSGFYRWLVAQGFPDDLGLTVLCVSCNHASHHGNGVCPHTRPDEAFATSTDPTVIAARVSWLERQLEKERHALNLPTAVGA